MNAKKMIDINKIQNWWLVLSEEKRIEIYKKRNPDCVDSGWSSWWYYMSDRKQMKIYQEENK
jgi:hypothetical protein